MSKYIKVERHEIFSDEYIDLINSVETMTAGKMLDLVMSKIEDYEKKYNLEFVSFYGNAYVIFKPSK